MKGVTDSKNRSKLVTLGAGGIGGEGERTEDGLDNVGKESSESVRFPASGDVAAVAAESDLDALCS